MRGDVAVNCCQIAVSQRTVWHAKPDSEFEIGSGLELTEIPNTGAFQFTRGGSPVDRKRTIQGSCSPTRHDPARRGGYWQRRHDMPVLWNLTTHLLPLAAPIPGAGT